VNTGRKGKQFLARSKRQMLADFELIDQPTFLQTKLISKFCIEKFLSGEVDRVTILYSRFINTLSQVPTKLTLLPISPLVVNQAAAEAHHGVAEYQFEPSAPEVLGAILPYYVHFGVFQAILDARASEHSARMVAMKSATDNAKQLVTDLTLEYNKVRQAAITSELLEITTAQMAIQ
jgi:F-type H+-transporting ATPase subunit gamma